MLQNNISEKKLDITFDHRKSLMVDDGSSQQISASGMYWNLNSVIMELKDIQELANQDKNNLV